jgi:hypothetical protein
LVLSKSSFGVAGKDGCLSEVCERGRVVFFLSVAGLRETVLAGISTLIQSLDFSAVSITFSSWQKATELHKQKKKTMIDLVIA